MMNWYESDKIDKSPIISSRVRLARNLAAYPFSARITADEAVALIDTVRAAVPDFQLIEPSKEERAIRLSMVENHDISPEALRLAGDWPFALLAGKESGIGIMVGEEDHIRIQAITPGNTLDEAFAAANEIDDYLEDTLNYAYHKEFGYLTSCPTNTGTGLRASFMVHLPMLERTKNLSNIVSNLSKLGMTVRGIYGESSKPLGSIYQVSNQVTLGKSEEEIIAELKNIGSQLVESEHALLQSAFTTNQSDMEDMIYRALGLLTHARKQTINEAMDSLSTIRIGVLSGVLKKDLVDVPIYRIMMNVEPGNLQRMAGEHLSENSMLIERARYLRELFGRN